MVRRLLINFFRSLVPPDRAPGHRPDPAPSRLRVGSVTILAADVQAPPGGHNPGASGSNPESAMSGARQQLRQDIRAECRYDEAWPVKDES